MASSIQVVSSAVSESPLDAPRQRDLDRCVHCGLCLNACPTYRELGLEMDSPRGRIYPMARVAAGAPITDSYVQHIELCLACRGCESACPSGVEYGRLVEAARAQIRQGRPPGVWERFVFERVLPSRTWLRLAAGGLWLYQKSGLQTLVRQRGILKLFGRLGQLEQLAPEAQFPDFFRSYGKVFPAQGPRRYRVAFLGGCMANVTFARMHEATVRVLQRNGCEVHVPEGQTCCGALHVHAGLRTPARRLARQNMDVLLSGNYDAIITNAAGCGSTLKEYDELLEHDPAYAEKARRFSALVKDVNEFLASIDLNSNFGSLPYTVTYQDSCHLAHGQRIRTQPRKLLAAIPGLKFREMPLADLCCGSAGIYNVLHTEMSLRLLEKKMRNVNLVQPDVIVTANPGCILQLRAGAQLYGQGQRVAHVVEILDEAYAAAQK